MKRDTFQGLPDEQADFLLVGRTLEAMTEKLALSRKKGRGGWHTKTCSNHILRQMLLDHIEKGDPIDIINLAAMMMVRESVLGDYA